MRTGHADAARETQPVPRGVSRITQIRVPDAGTRIQNRIQGLPTRSQIQDPGTQGPESRTLQKWPSCRSYGTVVDI
jgi:hypothetical protein